MLRWVRARVGRPLLILLVGILLVLVVLAGALYAVMRLGQQAAPSREIPASIHKIQHVVIIMQENRSFDNYFGTYPGADGIPMKNGVPTVCNPNPRDNTCIKPFHSRNDVELGGPHGAGDTLPSVNGGKMDGFAKRLTTPGWYQSIWPPPPVCGDPFNPRCTGGGPPDVMGYHTRADLPNYCSYADHFVLNDRMFAPAATYSLPVHLYMVSAWSAVFSKPNVASSCRGSVADPGKGPGVILPGAAGKTATAPNYAWTDLTYLLNAHGVSWKYYVALGTGPYCTNSPANGATCKMTMQSSTRGTPQLWNVLPFFTTVQQDHQQSNIQTLDHFYADARAGTLPAVSWIAPSGVDQHGRGLRDGSDQSDHARPGLAQHRHLPGLGRLGRLLRPRRAPPRGPERLRPARARPGDQPLREEGLHRPPDAQLRRLPHVHRGRLPGGPAAGPQDGRAAGPAAGRAGGRPGVGGRDRRLRLRPEATPAAAPAHPPQDRPAPAATNPTRIRGGHAKPYAPAAVGLRRLVHGGPQCSDEWTCATYTLAWLSWPTHGPSRVGATGVFYRMSEAVAGARGVASTPAAGHAGRYGDSASAPFTHHDYRRRAKIHGSIGIAAAGRCLRRYNDSSCDARQCRAGRRPHAATAERDAFRRLRHLYQRRHPQEQTYCHHHAGEPLLRQLLRHLPRRRRHPHEERRARGLQCRPQDAAVHQALSRPRGSQRRRTTFQRRCPRRHCRGQDERLRGAG